MLLLLEPSRVLHAININTAQVLALCPLYEVGVLCERQLHVKPNGPFLTFPLLDQATAFSQAYR